MAGQIVSCPQCRSRLRVPPEVAPGKRIQCPKCRSQFRVEDESPLADQFTATKPIAAPPKIADPSKARKEPVTKPKHGKIRTRKIEIGAVIAAAGLLLAGVTYWVWMQNPSKSTLPPKRGPGPLVAVVKKEPVKNNKSDILAKDGQEQPIQTLVHVLVPKDDQKRLAVVVLEKPSEPGPIRDQFRGILARELVRQAFALCVREELGLATRDLALAETYPPPADYSSGGEFVLKTSFFKGLPLSITLEKKAEDKWEPVFIDELPIAPPETMDYLALTNALEESARKKWPGILKEHGFPNQSRGLKSDEKTDAATTRLLDGMNYYDQFAAIRSLHSAIRQKGESPWVEGDLVRGYAQLSRLLRDHWNAAYKICQARSLLYAARLAAREPDSPWGTWHQAYAAALSGFPNAALDKLVVAQGKAKTGASKKVPDWVPVIEAFCRSDKKNLLKMPAPLARFLGMPWDRVAAGDETALEVVQEFLDQNPDCYLAWDALYGTNLLSVQHKVSVAPMIVMSNNLPARLLGIPGLPAGIQQTIKKTPNLGLREELDLVCALESAAALENDTGELAWSALAGFVRETRFNQIFQRLDFLQRRLSVPTQDEFLAYKPLVASHPLLPLLERHNVTFQAQLYDARKKEFDALDPAQFCAKFSIIVHDLDLLNPPKSPGSLLLRTHTDGNTSDLAAIIISAANINKAPYAHQLRGIDAHSTLALVTLIGTDWNSVAKEADLWEQIHGDKLDVLEMLGTRYMSLQRLGDAERCFKKYLALAPDIKGYKSLAQCYKLQKNDDQWLEALKEVLKLPDFGLAQTQVRVEIANYYMAGKEYKKALPYAEDAAQSWAAWAMGAASQCHEKLENWPQSELWVQRISERYASSARDWYHWCLRTGRGNLKEAALFAHNNKTQGPDGSRVEDLWIQVHLAALNKQPQTVLALFENNRVLTLNTNSFLLVALLCEELHLSSDRDQALNKVPTDSSAGRLADLFRERLQNPQAPFDKKKVDTWLANDPQRGDFGSYYLAGRILDLTGAKELALEYYQRAVAEPATSPNIRPLVILAIRAQGKEPEWKANK